MQFLKIRRLLYWLILLVAVAYVGAGICLYVFQRDFLYCVATHDEVPAIDAPEDYICVKGPQGNVEGWLLWPERAKTMPLIVECGGNGDDAVRNRKMYVDFPYPTLLWNYPGYGGSGGKPTEETVIASGLKIIEYVKQKYSPPGIIFLGRSLGAAVAVGLAEQEPPQEIILLAPSDTIAGVAGDYYPFFPVSIFISDRWNSVRRAAQINCPALMLVGGKDIDIRMHHSAALRDVWQGEVTCHVFPDLDHDVVAISEQTRPWIFKFLARTAQAE